jgi:hypothetical protein
MPQQINLYNPDFEERRSLLSWQGAVAGWAVTVVLAAAIISYQTFSLRLAEQRDRGLAAQLTAAQAEMQRLGSQFAGRKVDARVTEETVQLETEVKGRQEVMNVLKSGDLGDTRGFSNHLKAFARQSFDGVWLTRLSIATAGRDVSVQGRALQAAYVAGYLKRLNAESAMQGHPFSELLIQVPSPEPGAKTTTRPDYVEFRLTTKSTSTTVAPVGKP